MELNEKRGRGKCGRDQVILIQDCCLKYLNYGLGVRFELVVVDRKRRSSARSSGGGGGGGGGGADGALQRLGDGGVVGAARFVVTTFLSIQIHILVSQKNPKESQRIPKNIIESPITTIRPAFQKNPKESH